MALTVFDVVVKLFFPICELSICILLSLRDLDLTAFHTHTCACTHTCTNK